MFLCICCSRSSVLRGSGLAQVTNRSQLPCKWEVRARNVLPQPVMKVVVERSTPCERRMGKAIACSLRDD